MQECGKVENPKVSHRDKGLKCKLYKEKLRGLSMFLLVSIRLRVGREHDRGFLIFERLQIKKNVRLTAEGRTQSNGIKSQQNRFRLNLQKIISYY